MTRKKEREHLFCLVFEKAFRDEECLEILELAESIRDFEITDFIKDNFLGIYSNLEYIDDLIEKNIKNWRIERLPKSVLSLLRLAIYEMKLTEIPDAVTINEIVELSKLYCDEQDTSYINGVLGTISRTGENS